MSRYFFNGKESEMPSSTVWTSDGRRFIYELLKADGILPIAERDIRARFEDSGHTHDNVI